MSVNSLFVLGIDQRDTNDSCVHLSRDGKEELMQLNDEQRKQLQQRDSCRSG